MINAEGEIFCCLAPCAWCLWKAGLSCCPSGATVLGYLGDANPQNGPWLRFQVNQCKCKVASTKLIEMGQGKTRRTQFCGFMWHGGMPPAGRACCQAPGAAHQYSALGNDLNTSRFPSSVTSRTAAGRLPGEAPAWPRAVSFCQGKWSISRLFLQRIGDRPGIRARAHGSLLWVSR